MTTFSASDQLCQEGSGCKFSVSFLEGHASQGRLVFNAPAQPSKRAMIVCNFMDIRHCFIWCSYTVSDFIIIAKLCPTMLAPA